MVYQQAAPPPIPAMAVLLWLVARQEHVRMMVPGLVVSLHVQVSTSGSVSKVICIDHIVNDIIEPWHEISNNVVCATSKASDQPAHTRSLIRAFASRLNIL